MRSAIMYGTAAARVLARGRSPRLGRTTERLLFVCGSPRSGTTFLGGALGEQEGVVDLGEVRPLKAAVPRLAALPEHLAATELHRRLERVRRLGLSSHLRGVEQTPEVVFVLRAALRAYPAARAVHLVRDGRDVVCSLLERGWLGAGVAGADDVGQSHGAHARFWVEEDRRDEFERASDATRAAWAWRRHVEAGLRVEDERLLELRYEELAASPGAAAAKLAHHFELDAEPLGASLARVHERSVGRWQRDLTPEQLTDVEREAGALLERLGYRSAHR